MPKMENEKEKKMELWFPPQLNGFENAAHAWLENWAAFEKLLRGLNRYATSQTNKWSNSTIVMNINLDSFEIWKYEISSTEYGQWSP